MSVLKGFLRVAGIAALLAFGSANNLARQTQRVGPAAPPPVTYLPAIDPVSAGDLESVLRRDLAKTFRTGLLASGKPIGIAVGVVRRLCLDPRRQDRKLLAYSPINSGNTFAERLAGKPAVSLDHW